jgi:hypothetical protein
MRLHKFVTPEANRSGSRLQPKRHGAALIRKDSACIPSDPDIVMAKLNGSDFVGRNFRDSVHIFALGLKSSRNHKVLLSAKLNQVRLDGELHNSFGFALAPDIVNMRDEFAECQESLPVIGFHSLKCKLLLLVLMRAGRRPIFRILLHHLLVVVCRGVMPIHVH